MSGERPFGPYRLIRQIAVGGMAEIHLAKTHGLAGFEKYVAIKMIHPNFSQDENFIEMLIDEAKISVQLQHVNIAQAFDLGRVGDTYYITMEYVDGADLYRLLRRASEQDLDMPVDVAAYIAKEMANGLDYAHRRRGTDGQPLGIVHRDISPQNVLISHMGEIKLVDFGIAKATMNVRQTAVGVIKGKYYYMSPEQAWGDTVDHRTDIFSMGILLYEALTGQMLYLEEDMNRLMDMVRKANIPSPRRMRRDIPPQLERIVMHALEKRREDRYQTAADMAADLERFLHAYSPVFRPAKVREFFHKVLDQEPPPPTAELTVPELQPPSTLSERISNTDLLRERSEFSDENSVIFRMSEMARKRRPDDTRSATPAKHISLVADLDNIEEQTVISAPPGFAGATQVSAPGRAEFAEHDYEPTVVQSGAAGDTDIGTGGDMAANNDDDDDGPTMNHRAAKAPPIPRPRAAAEQRGSRRGMVHPALAAKAPLPPTSAARKPRQSRKTPTDSIAIQSESPRGQGAGHSLLSTLLGATGDIPEPVTRQPARGGGAGFPLQAPPQTPIPGPIAMAMPQAVKNAPDPFSPLPNGTPALSLTKQLQAIELEEIPAHYKIDGKGSSWLSRAVLILVCVAGGVGIGMAILASDDTPPVALEIKTIPEGVHVSVDGQRLPDKTPTRWTGAQMGKRYTLVFELEGYNPRTKDVMIDDHQDEVMVFLDRKAETVTLVISSEPEGAEIIIDDKSYGRAPKRISTLDPAHATNLELRLAGYNPHREVLDWRQATELEKTVRLHKK